jgi:hypothetical protein
MRLLGTPVRLLAYPCDSIPNARLAALGVPRLGRFYLPETQASLMDGDPPEPREFLEDDNRGAVSADPFVTLDGRPFHLSIKGIGSTVDPYSPRTLDVESALGIVSDPDVRARLQRSRSMSPGRLITGELWLRGSPYGGQGIEHARTALEISERADLTDLGGMRIAPVVEISLLPDALAERIRHIFWYRRYPGRIVQEARLVPSNVRIYFHARNTVGGNIAYLFDLFEIDSEPKAIAFEIAFLRTALPMLSLYARTLEAGPEPGRYRGLDFHDVWLDKDAVLAPDGSVFFVDLEGIEPVTVDRAQVRERIEDQIYRTLYELVFAYEQIEGERGRRFGARGTRKRQFEGILREAVRGDPFVGLEERGGRLDLCFLNKLHEPSLDVRFPGVDFNP